MRKSIDNAEDRYAAWKDMIKDAPTKLLTEDDWLRACRHFGKCAICGENEIDAKMYFVDFKQGGKYVTYNIIPVCEKCALSRLKYKNQPFRYLSTYYHGSGLPSDVKRKLLENIVDYLIEELNKAYEDNKT